MAVFSYVGVSDEQHNVRGTVAADTARSARDQLRDEGIAVQSIQELGQPTSGSWFASLTARQSRQHWTTAAHELSMMLRAGITLTEGLDTLADQYRGGFRESIVRLREQVASGHSLAEAMSDQPNIFDVASVRLVEVGENAGNLETVLQELADLRQRMQAFGDKVLTALLYPVFLVVFGLAAGVFLMTWVLPPLLENLEETLDVLPLPTRIARYISEILLGHGWWLAIVVVALVVVAIAGLRTERGRFLLDRALLRLPVIGPLVRKQGVARIAMVVGLLSRSGVTLNAAMELAASSTQNRILQSALRDCCRDMASGRDIADSLEQSNAFPPLAVRVFSVGQESGDIDEMLIRLGEDYNQQLQTATARVTALVEPVLILFLAVFVGFLLLATILPILEAGQIQ